MNAATPSTKLPSLSSRAQEMIENWQHGAQSVILKINDRVQYEIKDEGSFQKLLELLERLENIAAIQKGLDDFEAGRSITIDEFKQQRCL